MPSAKLQYSVQSGATVTFGRIQSKEPKFILQDKVTDSQKSNGLKQSCPFKLSNPFVEQWIF